MKTFVLFILLLFSSTAYAEDFFVSRVAVRDGDKTDQNISVLRKIEDANRNDYWDGYIKFSPNRDKKLSVVFTFKVDSSLDSGHLKMNVRGAFSDQEFLFFVKNFKTGEFELLGKNEGPKSWMWTAVSLSLPDDLAFYQRDGGMKIKMLAELAQESILIDQFILSHSGPADEPTQNPVPGEPTQDPPQNNPTPAEAPFTPGLTWYWQLSGNVDKNRAVDVYNIDLEDNASSGLINDLKTKGIKVVCYFSAGTYEEWRSDANLFTTDILGKSLGNWPGERWVDIRSEKTRAIMARRMDLAASSGCDAVEPDNVDGYQNNNGLGLTAQDQLDYLSWLADYAHNKGLKIALKNTVDLIQSGKLYNHFDFTINEECYTYNECDKLQPFINENKAVFIAEYNDSKKDRFCPSAAQSNYFLAFFSLDLDGRKYVPCTQ